MGGRNPWAFTMPAACKAVMGRVERTKEVEDWWFLSLGILQDDEDMNMR